MTGSESKVSSELQSRAQESADLVDVVVELQSQNAVEQSAPALQEAFTSTAAPVVERISDLGGVVTGEAWINQTVRARVPAKRVGELADLDEVAALDVPRAIEPD